MSLSLERPSSKEIYYTKREGKNLTETCDVIRYLTLARRLYSLVFLGPHSICPLDFFDEIVVKYSISVELLRIEIMSRLRWPQPTHHVNSSSWHLLVNLINIRFSDIHSTRIVVATLNPPDGGYRKSLWCQRHTLQTRTSIFFCILVCFVFLIYNSDSISRSRS